AGPIPFSRGDQSPGEADLLHVAFAVRVLAERHGRAAGQLSAARPGTPRREGDEGGLAAAERLREALAVADLHGRLSPGGVIPGSDVRDAIGLQAQLDTVPGPGFV